MAVAVAEEEEGRDRLLSAVPSCSVARGVAAGRNFCDDNHDGREEREALLRLRSVGRRPTHHGGWTRFSIRRKQLHYFAVRALYALSLSPGGIIPSSLFPHDASKTKDYPIHKVIVSLCRSVALIALYCVYAFLASEYLAALSRT